MHPWWATRRWLSRLTLPLSLYPFKGRLVGRSPTYRTIPSATRGLLATLDPRVAQRESLVQQDHRATQALVGLAVTLATRDRQDQHNDAYLATNQRIRLSRLCCDSDGSSRTSAHRTTVGQTWRHRSSHGSYGSNWRAGQSGTDRSHRSLRHDNPE